MVTAYALPTLGVGGELSVAGLKVLTHLFLEHLLQDNLNAVANSSLRVQLHFVLELVFRGQVSPPSVNP